MNLWHIYLVSVERRTSHEKAWNAGIVMFTAGADRMQQDKQRQSPFSMRKLPIFLI